MINNLITIDQKDDLVHYGIKRRSGRYPWGSGERPYQGDGISTPKKRGLLSFRRKDKKAEKEKSTLPDPSSQEYQKAKEKALKSGTATEILRFKGSLTTNEMQQAVSRINLERQLSDISRKEKDDGWNAINGAMRKVGNVKDWTKTGLEIYDLVEQISKRAGKKAASQSSK